MSWVKRVFGFPGAARSPAVVLAQTADKLPRIKAVAICILWDDDSVAFDWSNMPKSSVSWLAAELQKEVLSWDGRA